MNSVEDLKEEKKYEIMCYSMFADEVRRVTGTDIYVFMGKNGEYFTDLSPTNFKTWKERLNYFIENEFFKKLDQSEANEGEN